MTAVPAATSPGSHALPLTATIGALGVVYGDIGTSPLYALKEAAKAAAHGGPLTSEAILGVVSLIFWALILIISLKYALLILRVDNPGEGGIVALLALLSARDLRTGHARLVPGDRTAWRSRHRPRPRRARRLGSAVCFQFPGPSGLPHQLCHSRRRLSP